LSNLITKLTYVEDAVSKLCESVKLNIGSTEVKLLDSLGLISFNDVEAPYDYPPFDRSVVDGFAVRAEDTYGASPTSPIELKLVGAVGIGEIPEIEISSGEAVEVATGSPIPKGANAVVMKEDVEVRDGRVVIYSRVPALANIARRGEDLRAGEVILRRGEVITPFHISALATYGISKVKVFRKVKVAVIPTGSEVVDIEEDLGPGKVRDSTSYLVASYLRRFRFLEVERVCNPVPDDVKLIREVIEDALSSYDIVLTTGGTSVGKKDLVPKAVLSIEGAKLVFRGVAIRPGRPVSAAVVNGKPVIMLSGLPVAAYSALKQVFIPFIKYLLSIRDELIPKVVGKLVRRVPNAVGYNSLVRVRAVRRGSEYLIEPIRLKGSGSLRTLLEGNAVLIINHDLEGYEAGEYVVTDLIKYVLG